MDDIIIENFELSDLNSIKNNLESDFDSFWNYTILEKELNDDSSIYLCCKSEDKIIGFAGISIVLDAAELNSIVIKKSKRGNGYSSLLLKKLIQIAKSKKCTKINLEVAIDNIIAISLYKKFGFVQVGKRQNYYNGIDALLFTLHIN